MGKRGPKPTSGGTKMNLKIALVMLVYLALWYIAAKIDDHRDQSQEEPTRDLRYVQMPKRKK